MRLAFYRSQYGDWIDRIIDLATGNRGFSHTELVFSDGLSFSSSPRDGGVRFKPIGYRHPARWKFIDFYATPTQEAVMRDFAEKQVGKGYDWLGAVGVVLHTPAEPGRFFCSEVCVATLQRMDVFYQYRASALSPNDMEILAEKLWSGN